MSIRVDQVIAQEAPVRLIGRGAPTGPAPRKWSPAPFLADVASLPSRSHRSLPVDHAARAVAV